MPGPGMELIGAEEKQALLEAADLPARASLLETLFTMGATEPLGGEATRH